MHVIVNSRPNFSFAIKSLVQYVSNLGATHIQTLKCIMWYIKDTLIIGIKYQKCEGGAILHGFFNVDLVKDKDTWCFTSRYCFL
jgi:hypothetical protein